MLAQNFKTPTDLGLSDIEFESLVKVLGMLERGDIKAKMFNMNDPGDSVLWNENDCGSPQCIVGWARYVARKRIFFGVPDYRLGVRLLFCMSCSVTEWIAHVKGNPFQATPDQAAFAIRSYLRTGKPNWTEALAE